MPGIILPPTVPGRRLSPVLRRPSGSAPRRVTDWRLPTVAATVAVLALIAPILAAAGGDPSALAWFGSVFAHVVHPPPGAVVTRGTGYDGQYFYALARDPLLLGHSTLVTFATQGFRLQRIAYPLLAFALAGGRAAEIPWTLLLVNLAAVIVLVAIVARYAVECGRSAWWGLVAGLLPGVLFAVLADLADALAVCGLLAALIAHRRGQHWRAAGWLTLAVLAREPMMLAVVAWAIDAAVTRRRDGDRSPSWLAVVVPALAFGTWHGYLAMRAIGPLAAPATAYQQPFAGVGTEITRALAFRSPALAGWDLGYLALMGLAVLAALAAVVRGYRGPAALAGLLYGLTLPFLTFGGAISYTRQSAPIFACLLFIGLSDRLRVPLALAAVSAGLGGLMLLGVW